MKLDPRYHWRYIQGAGGTKLFVEETGDSTKQAIVWIHGFCQSHLTWDKQFEDVTFASQFHMVRMDLRGHGLSDKLTDSGSYMDSQTWADDIHAVITTLNLKKPVLAGWSYGGYIMCDYIRHYGQDNLGGLIFIAAATEMGRREASSMMGGEFLALIPGLFSDDYVQGITTMQQFMELLTYKELDLHTLYFLVGISAITMPATRKGMFSRKLDNKELLGKITLPTLIVQGKNDRIILPAFADFIAQYIPHALRGSYDNCGHVPFVEMVERFNADVVEFMNTL
jgi:pimeloyl-ACP methyl ester carboxylesterase